jgi:hypothetical protein
MRRRVHWRNLLALWPMALLVSATAARAIADDAPPSRLEQLMAGYVLNFTRFAEWPDALRQREIVICVAGNPGLFSARRAGLHISSNLLQLAASVEGGEPR